MATDPVEKSWEQYSGDTQSLDEKLTRGEKQDFRNGSITLEFWKCFGDGDLQLQLKDCYLQLPIPNGKSFLDSQRWLRSAS